MSVEPSNNLNTTIYYISEPTQTQGKNHSLLLTSIDVWRLIISFSEEDLSNCALVDKKWKKVAYDIHQTLLKQMPIEQRYGSVQCTELVKPNQQPWIPLDIHQRPSWKLLLLSDAHERLGPNDSRKVTLQVNDSLSYKQKEVIFSKMGALLLTPQPKIQQPEQAQQTGNVFWLTYDPRFVHIETANPLPRFLPPDSHPDPAAPAPPRYTPCPIQNETLQKFYNDYNQKQNHFNLFATREETNYTNDNVPTKKHKTRD